MASRRQVVGTTTVEPGTAVAEPSGMTRSKRSPARTAPRILEPAELATATGGLPIIRRLVEMIEGGGEHYYEARMSDLLVSSY